MRVKGITVEIALRTEQKIVLMASYDYYEILGVPRDASAEQIRSAYRALAQRVHPDGGGTAGVFDYVQRAYDTLSNQEKRRLYDSSRARGDNVDGDLDDEDTEDGQDDGYEHQKKDYDSGSTQWDADFDPTSYKYLRGRGFEVFLVQAFRNAGFQVRHTPELFGIDLFVTNAERTAIIQATGSSNPIASNIVASIDVARRHHEAESAVVVTNSVFSVRAKQYGAFAGIELWDGEQLKRFLDDGSWPDGGSQSFSQEPKGFARNSQNRTRSRQRYSTSARLLLSIGPRNAFVVIAIVLIGLLILVKLLAAWIGLIFWGVVIFAIARFVREKQRSKS